MQCPQIAQNLQENHAQSLALHECRFAHLRELAALLHREFAAEKRYLASEAFALRYRQEMHRPLPDTDAVPPLHRNDVLRQNHLLCADSAMYLCRAILSIYRQAQKGEVDAQWFCTPSEAEQFPYHSDRIAYLKNAFSEEAFQKFLRIFPSCGAHYCEDFQSVCEEVALGHARYGILPWESSKDGRLKTFEALLQKHDMKLILLCEVPMGEDVTRFALFGRRVQTVDCGRQKEASFFSMRISCADTAPWHTPSLSILLSAASYFGLHLLRISSLPSQTNAEFDLTFATDSADIVAFLFYLSLEFPQFDPIGLYSLLKN